MKLKKKLLDGKKKRAYNQDVASKRMRFADRVKGAGYKSVEAFFLANATKTHKEMARLLGLGTHGSIGQQYRKWLEEKLHRKE